MPASPAPAWSLPAWSSPLSVDLMAGAAHQARKALAAPRILVLDSGLGGLTVLSEIVRSRPDAHCIYIADDAAFPYGAWAADALIGRLAGLTARLIAQHAPDCVVLACNTASTLALPTLRERFPTPFIGTVPAIKPAAKRSHSRMFSVLATPGTVARDYTRCLIANFAGDCDVTLVGSVRLAAMAEAQIAGAPAADADILAEILPCFVERPHDGGVRRTDVVTLSCTHYPLLLDRLTALAPWPVAWIDPAPAIARRVVQLFGPQPAGCADGTSSVGFTSGRAAPDLTRLPAIRALVSGAKATD